MKNRRKGEEFNTDRFAFRCLIAIVVVLACFVISSFDIVNYVGMIKQPFALSGYGELLQT